MSECLITKLKGTVSDDTIAKLNELLISIDDDTPSGGVFAICVGGSELTCRVTGDAYFTDTTNAGNNGNTTTISSSEAYNLYIANGDCKLGIMDYKDITRFSLNYGSDNAYFNPANAANFTFPENFKYCTAMKVLQIAYAKIAGSFDTLPQSESLNLLALADIDNEMSLTELSDLWVLTSLGLNSMENLSGSISNITKYSSTLTSLSLQDSPNITGELKDLAALRLLTTANIQKCSGISGTIEDYVAARRSLGDTTGSVNSCYFYNTGITFDGESTGVYSGALSWTATQITFNNKTITA